MLQNSAFNSTIHVLNPSICLYKINVLLTYRKPTECIAPATAQSFKNPLKLCCVGNSHFYYMVVFMFCPC